MAFKLAKAAGLLNSFQAKGLVVYPLKMSENLWFSGGKEMEH